MRFVQLRHRWVGIVTLLSVSMLLGACTLFRPEEVPSVTGPIPYTGSEPHTIGLWHFHETGPLEDASASGFTLQEVGSGEMKVLPGMFGTGVRSIGNHTLAFNPKGALGDTFSIEAWIRLDENPTARHTLFNSRWPTNTWELDFIDENERIVFRFWDENGLAREVSAPISPELDTWYHIAIVVSPTEDEPKTTRVRLYFTPEGMTEAQQIGDVTADRLMRDHDTNFVCFGNAGTDQSNRYFRGVFDEVRLSNAALSATDFTTLGR